MKALQFEQYGPPSVLSLEERDLPKPGAGEVLVEIKASAINPSDVGSVAGVFKTSLPRVPGRDFAGVVVAGDGSNRREVWGSGAGFGVVRDGVHAQYVVMPSDWLSEKPPNLSMEQAAAVGIPYLAAWSSFVRAASIQAGETALIIGAAGAVGRAAIQIARWRGARVIGAVRSEGAAGADAFINTATQDLPKEVMALTDGKGADLILDAVGGSMFELALKSLRLGGRQVAITSAGERRVSFDLVDFYHNLSRLFGVDTMKLTGGEVANIMDELRVGFEGGHLQPPAVTTWSLNDAVKAYQAVEKGGAPTRNVLVLG